MLRQLVHVLLVAALIGSLAACSTSRRDQLHRVAKDWAETIRASQVIAVYPLTQDIQPGDVFLVQTPIDQQQRAYREDGFLPLDNHIARLHPDGYGSFYKTSFLDQTTIGERPKDWIKSQWETAPAAAFPTYAFSVDASQGAKLALPISGVPVGLSLLGTRSARGFVNLEDARTVGLDIFTLDKEVRDWIEGCPDRLAFVERFAPRDRREPTNFLRVISRIYLLGAIDVQLTDARAVAGGADAAAAPPIELFLAEPPANAQDVGRSSRENYLRGIQRLNQQLSTGGDPPTPAADPNFSAREYNQWIEARDKAQAASLEAAKADAAEADDALTTAEETAAESSEGETLNTARDEATKATDARKRAEEALAEFNRQNADDEAEQKRLEEALEGALKTESRELEELKAAQTAFQEAHGPDLLAARVKSDVAAAQLARLQGFAPGGSLRFTAASSRSISMKERFEQPLVVGYLGFDVPILAGGELGPPIPTWSLLENTRFANRIDVDLSGPAAFYRDGVALAVYEFLSSISSMDARADDARRKADNLAKLIPDEFPVVDNEEVLMKKKSDVAKGLPGFKRYHMYLTITGDAIRRLRTCRHSAQPSILNTLDIECATQLTDAHIDELEAMFAETAADRNYRLDLERGVIKTALAIMDPKPRGRVQ